VADGGLSAPWDFSFPFPLNTPSPDRAGLPAREQTPPFDPCGVLWWVYFFGVVGGFPSVVRLDLVAISFSGAELLNLPLWLDGLRVEAGCLPAERAKYSPSGRPSKWF